MSGMRIEESGGYARDADGLMASKAHIKKVAAAEGAGALMDMERDTNEGIVRDQKAADAKVRGKPFRAGYRY